MMGNLSVAETKLRAVLIILDNGGINYRALQKLGYKKRTLYDAVKILVIRGYVIKKDGTYYINKVCIHKSPCINECKEIDSRAKSLFLTTEGLIYIDQFKGDIAA